ncbi:MAG: hypothetical protein JJU02_08440 [Cryomorphaceae bacterium]|nr:hypothetical protein [Cryomorphaceae bacterium]
MQYRRIIFVCFILSCLHTHAVPSVDDSLAKSVWTHWAQQYPLSGTIKFDTVFQWNIGQQTFVRRLALQGRTSNNLPIRDWTWTDEVFELQVTGIKNKRLEYRLPATKKTWKASFSQGLLHGKYSVEKVLINDKSSEKIHNIEGQWVKGVPHGKWQFNHQNQTFTGQFAEGFMHGHWEATDSLNRSWDFEKGIILERCEYSDSCGNPMQFRTHEDLKQALQSDSLLRYSIRGFGWKSLPTNEDTGLSPYEKIYNTYFTILDHLGLDSLGAKDKLTRILVFDMEPEVKSQLEQLAHNSDSLLTLSGEIMLGSMMRIHRNRRDLLEKYHNQIEADTVFFNGILKLTDRLLHEDVRFEGWRKNAQKVINNEAPELPDWESEYLKLLGLMLDEAAENLSLTVNLLKELEPELRREIELEERETALLSSVDELKASWQDRPNPILCWIENTFPSMLEAYASAPTSLEQSKLLLDLEVLTNRWRMVERAIVVIEKTPLKLEEQYIQYAYNPYTGDYSIEVRIKRRFYQKTMDLVWPHLTNQLCQVETTEGLENAIRQLEQFHLKMLHIAGKSEWATRRLERRVRRENDPERIWRLIRQY